MSTVTNASIPLRLFGAALVLAIIAAIALTVTLTAGPTQAQNATNTYDDPQPCGPAAETAYQPEPHEITEGHFALFDAYWQWTSDENLDNTGVLHTNTCPPLVSETENDDGETVTNLTASGIDIDEAIFHVLDDHKATVVASASENPSGVEISTAEYVKLGNYAAAGSQVWWLRLDDPDTTTVDETSSLSLGFSTKRLEDQFWGDAEDNGPPLRYKYELQRHPGIAPTEHPHFLAYRAPGVYQDGEESKGVELVWDSARADVEDLMMEPGEIENLQWVFTKPGTYVLSVHLQGWVRKARPDGAGRDWLPISGNTTETSEVKRYVIQVGNELDENEPPVFGLNLTVPENSPADTLVGAPVPIYEADADTLYYTLSGDGHEHFVLEPTTNPHAVQIKVAAGANLDYETKSIYKLTLSVTDRIDHESNPDPTTIDDTLEVRIALEDEPPSLTLSPTDINPQLGESVTVSATVTEAPSGSTPVLTWYEKDENQTDWSEVRVDDDHPYRLDHIIVHRERHAIAESFRAKCDWGTGSVWSNVVTLHWQEPQ
ncbi:MAG: hypothetical protein OXH30_09860 [Chloroflexi bacterium]|nr:hypothetical protein [Chloroflexota bacterium]